jgi:hypothetical protein
MQDFVAHVGMAESQGYMFEGFVQLSERKGAGHHA